MYASGLPTGEDVWDARRGFVRCLKAFSAVERGQDITLAGWPPQGMPLPFMRMLERLSLGLNTAPAPFIGNWSGKVLLVGERPSGSDEKLVDWPFVSVKPDGCSTWLASMLEEHGIPEEMLCWVNAYDRCGENQVIRHDLSHFKLIVAFGKNAHLALGSVPHTQVHHPEYWKRFHYDEPYKLPAKIKEIL